ncbi:permease prefix domain 1-containing protein [Erysipelothrix amsterdamensis]|uniref:Permease prefix domain 1-containing protein n=1 Tax=Erysipelothrix amsterdamensis TaxID=2929157 RepID=A0AAU9VHB9_9FIRM|nr:permease prefix domain 1-containing protein [Erysipelothrix sp. A18Y020d]CAH2761063.1 permease prefix domain 1-containing protein [Erysipelothrix sp. A18Y020d]
MNQILDYIEVMFKSLPHTDEVEKLKMNMTDSMELKFNQYLEEGKRESEAIGLVIGEFGSIEELKEALGLNMNDDEGVIYLETPRVEEYLIFIKRFAMMISMGVAVIMVGIGATEYFDNLIIFFLSLIVGVTLFVYYGMLYATYDDITDTGIVDSVQYQRLNKIQKNYQPSFIRSIVLGVALCIIAVFSVVYLEDFMHVKQYSSLLFMFITAIAVVLFINAGVNHSHLVMLTSRHEWTKSKAGSSDLKETLKREERIESITGILMGLAAMVYLILGFTMNLWHPGWIIFPIVALVGELITNIKKE